MPDLSSGQPWIPDRVFVEVQMSCPHRCAQCYQVANGLDRDRHLPLPAALERIAQLKRLGVREVVPVTGEVLEHPEYLACYAAAGWTEYLVTNGRRLLDRPELGPALVETGFRRLRISAHYFGPGERPELRHLMSPYRLAEVPRIVEAAGRYGLAVEAFMLVGRFNYRRLAEAFRRAQTDGLSTLLLINLMPTSPAVRPYCLDVGQAGEVFDQVGAIRRASRGASTKLRLVGNFGPRPGSAEGQRLAAAGAYCPAGRQSAYLTVDGSVYGCHFLLDPKLRIGRLVDGQLVLDSGDWPLERRTCPLTLGPVDRTDQSPT